MTTDAVDLETWFVQLFSQINRGQLQTLVVSGTSFVGNLGPEVHAQITARLRPHKLRLILIHEQAVLTRIRANELLRDLYPTLITAQGREWLARELKTIKDLANAA